MAWLGGGSGGVYARLIAAYCGLLRPFGFLGAKPLRQGPGGAKGSRRRWTACCSLLRPIRSKGGSGGPGVGDGVWGSTLPPCPALVATYGTHTHTHGLGGGRRPAGSPACWGLLRLSATSPLRPRFRQRAATRGWRREGGSSIDGEGGGGRRRPVCVWTWGGVGGLGWGGLVWCLRRAAKWFCRLLQ